MSAHSWRSETRRILLIASLGGALEFYDFVVFAFLASMISKLFVPPETPDWLGIVTAFGIFSAGYFFRPLGGIILAQFGDLFGRKRVFVFSILLMAISTLGMALLPTYASIGMLAPLTLLLLRILQGAAIGGEVPGAWTYVAEQVPSHRVGFACGFLCSGLTLGILLGALISAALHHWFSDVQILEFAWRIPFLLGGVFGMLGVLLRKLMSETPIFMKTRDERQLVAEMPLRVLLRNHTRGIVLSMIATWALSAGVVVTTLMTPRLLESLYGYSAETALYATCFGTLFLFAGLTSAGYLADRFGAGPSLIVGAFLFALTTYLFYTFAGTSPDLLYVLYGAMGLSVGVIGIVPLVMVRAFPSHVRFTGVSFSYNVSYAFYGGVTPVLIATLVNHSPMVHVYYLLMMAVVILMLGVYLVWEPGIIGHRPGEDEGRLSVSQNSIAMPVAAITSVSEGNRSDIRL